MNAEIKARWIAKLGVATQGTGALRPEPDKRCCLGVLDDVAAEDGVGAWDDAGDGCLIFRESDAEHGWTLRQSGDMLTSGVMSWAGLDDDAGTTLTLDQIRPFIDEDLMLDIENRYGDTDTGTGTVSLAELNDIGVDFATIAKLIDRYL